MNKTQIWIIMITANKIKMKRLSILPKDSQVKDLRGLKIVSEIVKYPSL